MADICYNSLRINGFKEHMKEFYKVLHSSDNKFYMNKFVTIPDELYGIESHNCFEKESKKTFINDDGRMKTLSVDKAGRTLSEFKEYVNELEQRYGCNNQFQWCDNNWGSTSDVIDQIECEDNTDIQYTVIYETEYSTVAFVDNLFERFPQLNYELLYIDSYQNETGAYFRNSSINACITKSWYNLYILRDFNKCSSFCIDEEENPKSHEIHSIALINWDWESILEQYNFNSKTVEDWDDLKEELGI